SALGFADDTAASEWLIREVGVAGVPGSSFFRDPVTLRTRFHVATRDAPLRPAGERLGALAVRAPAGR
ncbi:MAG: aminotransferase, partial [Gemmatimonas sp.]